MHPEERLEQAKRELFLEARRCAELTKVNTSQLRNRARQLRAEAEANGETMGDLLKRKLRENRDS